LEAFDFEVKFPFLEGVDAAFYAADGVVTLIPLQKGE
jgi:hypothetical protein